MDTVAFLSIKNAAHRVGRDIRTIERWIAEGDLEIVEVKNQNGTVVHRFVSEHDLLATLRAKLHTNPSRSRHEEGD